MTVPWLQVWLDALRARLQNHMETCAMSVNTAAGEMHLGRNTLVSFLRGDDTVTVQTLHKIEEWCRLVELGKAIIRAAAADTLPLVDT
jgi:DNA transposition AAA+ family ATPase